MPLAFDFELWARFFKHAHLYSVAAPLAVFRRHPRQKMANRYEEYTKEAEEILRYYGGKQYSKLEALGRRALQRVFFFIPFRKVLSRIGPLVHGMGFCYPVNILSWKDDAWKMTTHYVP